MSAAVQTSTDKECLLPAAEDQERGLMDDIASVGSSETDGPVFPRSKSRRTRWNSAAGLLVVGACFAGATAVGMLAHQRHRGMPTSVGGSGGVVRLDASSAVAAAPAASTTPKPREPSFFCFAVMKAGGPEQELVEFQLKRRAGIFKCQDFAVISSEKVNLGYGDNGNVTTWFNPAPQVGIGQLGGAVTTNSYLNTEIFMIAWDTLIKSKQLEGHDFVVKADPDCVWFPDRLAQHVKPYIGQAVFFPNCNLFPESPPVGPKLYGALEVYSKQAIDLYADSQGHERCMNLDWHGWGEDYFMQECMLVLGAREQADYTLVGDHRCIPAGCDDWTRVAFHDFKTPEAWDNCFKTAIGEK